MTKNEKVFCKTAWAIMLRRFAYEALRYFRDEK